MNILHMKYAVEVARCGSINKAAEVLLMNQPNLSRAIKELETSLGVRIFSRSARGMVPTPDGETFLRYANTILKQVDEVEAIFRTSGSEKKRFSISVPRASYISEAFSNFSLALQKEKEAEIFYKETDSAGTIRNMTEADYKLGIIRYAVHFDRYYKRILEEKQLAYEQITEFEYLLVMHKDSPLAKKDDITFQDLEQKIEITHADPNMPSIPFSEIQKEEHPYRAGRRIFVFERASQFELLAKNPETFMWVSPVPEEVLSRFGLVQRSCGENRKAYRDLFVYRKDYQLSELDRAFLRELNHSCSIVF